DPTARAVDRAIRARRTGAPYHFLSWPSQVGVRTIIPSVEIFLGLVLMALAAGVTLILPLVAWIRTHRLERQMSELRARLASLEEAVRIGHAAVPGAPPVVAPDPTARERLLADAPLRADPLPAPE